MIHHGDCIDVMAAMEPESVDAIVTDPPYNLTSIGQRFGKPGAAAVKDDAFGGRYGRLARGFMGKTWDGDGIAFRPETWAAMLRLAKPSAYLLAFGGTRTVHRMTVALEDAGWIIRDMLVWAYASGFPKSKASLKPAWEPIVMARKPGPLRMLAIDECRIPFTGQADVEFTQSRMAAWERRETWEGAAAINVRKPTGVTSPQPQPQPHEDGRWPSNVMLTDPIFDGDTPGVVGGGLATAGGNINGRPVTGFGGHWADSREFDGYTDEGTYSRFFVIPKADRTDREPVLRTDREPVLRTDRERIFGDGLSTETKSANPTARHNVHPTVKPTELMRHLVRLVTPSGGTVLDPFLGSGTTGIACELEGFPWIGIEKEAEYVAIAEARLNGTQRGMGLSA